MTTAGKANSTAHDIYLGRISKVGRSIAAATHDGGSRSTPFLIIALKVFAII